MESWCLYHSVSLCPFYSYAIGQDMAAAMHRGLLMSQAEKETRHAKLHSVITTHTSQTWAMTLVKLLLGIVDAQGIARQTPVLPTHRMLERYSLATKRLFLLDYDVRSLSNFFFLLLPTSNHIIGYLGTHRKDTLDGGPDRGHPHGTHGTHCGPAESRLHHLWPRWCVPRAALGTHSQTGHVC
jgi:hypothetical protein